MMTTRRALTLLLLAAVVLFGGGARRRAVGPAVCPAPTLTFSVTPARVCNGGDFTISWQASQANASVAIAGIAGRLPASGARNVSDGRRSFSGRASNGCSTGPEASLNVPAPEAASGTIAGPLELRTGTTGSFQVTVSGAVSWSITSQTGNIIDPSNGTGNGVVTYYANRTGNDVVVLHVAAPCEAPPLERAASVNVTGTSNPPPPTGKLQCCDNTFSPTCTSCASKQGCCSGHGGVCSCPKLTSDRLAISEPPPD
jgi:hypothetical protein